MDGINLKYTYYMKLRSQWRFCGKNGGALVHGLKTIKCQQAEAMIVIYFSKPQ